MLNWFLCNYIFSWTDRLWWASFEDKKGIAITQYWYQRKPTALVHRYYFILHFKVKYLSAAYCIGSIFNEGFLFIPVTTINIYYVYQNGIVILMLYVSHISNSAILQEKRNKKRLFCPTSSIKLISWKVYNTKVSTYTRQCTVHRRVYCHLWANVKFPHLRAAKDATVLKTAAVLSGNTFPIIGNLRHSGQNPALCLYVHKSVPLLRQSQQ